MTNIHYNVHLREQVMYIELDLVTSWVDLQGVYSLNTILSYSIGVFLVRKLLHKGKLRVQDYELVRTTTMTIRSDCYY